MSVLQSIAAITGGEYQQVSPTQPPQPFFGDCNGNGVDDDMDIANGFSVDCNGNGIPDECEAANDCNANGVPDDCDFANGNLLDQNSNGFPDRCEGYHLELDPVANAGVPLTLSVVNNESHAPALFVAGFVPGNLPLPACGGVGLGIIDFASYGFPMLWVVTSDGEGFASLTLPVPTEAVGAKVLFQVVDPKCQASDVVEVKFK